MNDTTMASRPEGGAVRPNVYREPEEDSLHGVVERPVPTLQRLWNQDWLRKSLLLVVLAAIWELYARYLGNSLVLPTFTDTVRAMAQAFLNGDLLARTATSMDVLLTGYVAGIALAGLLTLLAITTRLGTDLLELLTAMFNPLPAIALLPLALVWFGLGKMTLVFVLVHSVLWAVTLNTYSGFQAVSPTLRMVGRNYGLSHLGFVCAILIPAAFPSILAGLKIGWAFAWRTLIAAELVFGVSASSGGLGWFIYESKNHLDIPAVFAGLLTIIVVGLFVENLIFRLVEERTIKRWGMQV